MAEILNPLLTLLLVYGYPILVIIIIGGYIGLPLPVSVCLVAAGAFAQSGTLNIFVLLPLVTLTAVIGDVIEYWLGRKYGQLIFRKLKFLNRNNSFNIQNVDDFFIKWGGIGVFLTRWLITPIAIPVNILAGSGKYQFRKFIGISILGEIIWAFMYLSLGYVFGSNWVSLIEFVNETPYFLVLAAAGFGLLFLGFKSLKR